MATVPVRAPFRLDLTANALRRLSTNVVDTYTPQDGFIRAYRGALVVVRQLKRDSPLDVRTLGNADFDPVALSVRMLGPDRDLRPFYRAVKAIPWLDALATRMRGIKPPRYPSLWETIVNAVLFQQVSIHAATAILGRVVEHLSKPLEYAGRKLYPFFTPEEFLRTRSQELRKLGISESKELTLNTSADALTSGLLQEADLERMPTSEAMARLMMLRGIGPWTAALICLRGLGRLDVFPMEDAGAQRAIADLSGDPAANIPRILEVLGDQRGMLYYHLLLGRLAARGALETADEAVLVAPPPPARPPFPSRRPPQRHRRRPGPGPGGPRRRDRKR
jgi:DNA-3-methyladenine glycosylase II